MDALVRRVMDARLAGLLARWRLGPVDASSLADHADHLLVIESGDGHLRYRHYGRAFANRFGADLTGQAVDMLPAEVVTAERRGMLEFDYLFVLGSGKPLWRAYTADFGGRRETWQRLVLPLGEGRLAVGAYPAATPDKIGEGGEALLRLVIERVPVVLGPGGAVEDLALSLEAFSSTRSQLAEMEVLA
ncbi:MAG: GGDEF domain-containing protein, partial [Pseudomonadota bacterium]